MNKRVVPIICLVDSEVLERSEAMVEQMVAADPPLSEKDKEWFAERGWSVEMLLYGTILETALRPIVGLPIVNQREETA